MATVLDTFITRFGFETDKTGLNKAEKGLSDFKSAAIKIAASVGSILGGGFFISKVAEAADETIKWADANGLVVETLGELEFAVQRQGGTVDGLRTSLSNMNRAIGEVERGTGRAKLAFEDYGISIKNSNGQTKTADELLVDLNKKFTSLSRAQQFDLAMKMGIDKGTILLLQTAHDEIARLRLEAAKLGVLSRRDAARAAEFVDGMTNIAQAINAIKFEISGFVFKPLADFFKSVANGIAFMRQHKTFFIVLIGLIGAVGAAYNAMAIKAAIAWLISLGPVLALPAAIFAVISAIALLTEDFIAFFKGQDSAIGDLVKKWPIVGDIILSIRDAFKIAFQTVADGFKIWWGWMVKIGKGIVDFILNPIELTLFALKKLNDLGNKINKFLGFGDVSMKIQEPLPAGGGFVVSPLLTRSNRAVGQQTSVKVENLTVDARGGDSNEIAQNVSSALSDQLKNTVEDFDSRIER